MSIFRTIDATCPACDQSFSVTVYASVNADRAPELREAILERSLQQCICGSCKTIFRSEPSLSYVDLERGQWLLVKPLASLARWGDLEAHALRLFARAYGTAAPPVARAVGVTMKARIAFGWEAAREKILCASNQIDDVALELVKLAILRSASTIDLSHDAELRLLGVEGNTLTLGWLYDGVPREMMQAPLSLLDAVTAPAWGEAREAIAAGPYVDINRILVPTLA